MASANTRVRISIDAVTCDGDSNKEKKKQEKYLIAYAGSVGHIERDHGIILAKMNGTIGYVYFIFNNVFMTSNDVLPIDPSKIKIGMVLNFHVININIPLVNNIKCFHAGLLWKVKKPNMNLVTIDPSSGLALLQSYLGLALPKEIPLQTTATVKIPTPPKEKRLAAVNSHNQKVLIRGASGFLWRAINANEGMMLQKREKGSLVIWFNKSNLEKVKMKFNSVQELYGIPLHYDAELLYAPANPNDYVWYQGIAFWDSGTPKPVLPTGLVGAKIFDYNPTSEFSLLLKEGLELQRTNKFDPSKLDNVFRQLTKTTIFMESPPKPQAQPIANKVKQEKVRKSSLPDSNLLPVFTPNWRASCSSLPNDCASTNLASGINSRVKKKNESSGESRKEFGAILVGPTLTQPKDPEIKRVETQKVSEIHTDGITDEDMKSLQKKYIKGFGENICFLTSLGHLLNIKEPRVVPDYFSRALEFKSIFNSKGSDELTEPTRLEYKIERWVTGLHKGNNAKSDQEKRRSDYVSLLPLDILNSKAFFPFEEPAPKYLLKLKGSTLHIQQELKMGLIYCEYGFAIFDFENFYDFNKTSKEWRKEKKIVNGLNVFFDAIPKKGSIYRYVATCVWVEKRPDISALITSTAKIPDNLKPGKYSGQVVKLDLPSNAIVKLAEEDVAVVVTRSIFDPNKIINIAEYLRIGQEIVVVIEKSENFFYAQNAIRYNRPQFELDPNKNVKGYGVITNYSNHVGIFQFKSRSKVHSGIFSKDLAKYFDDNGLAQYFPIGSCIYFKGYDMRLDSRELSVIANEIKGSKVLKENEDIFSNEMKQSEFILKKIYSGIVKEIRKPYAFILECQNESGTKERVFVSSRNFLPSGGNKNLDFCDQIQNYIKINDSVVFTTEMCSSTDLHPYKWHAAQAWKVKCEPISCASRQSSSGKETEESAMGDSFMTACSDNYISDSDISEAISRLQLRSNDDTEKKMDLKIILRDVMREEVSFPHSVINRIVDKFFKKIQNNSKLKDLNNLVGNAVPEKSSSSRTETHNQGSQTLSTGKVLYFKIAPS